MNSKNAMMAASRGLVGLFLVVGEVFLAIRFVLHFFAVNPTNGFAAWVFNSTNSLMAPFRGVFTNTVSGHPHFVDLQTLFVMGAYAVVAAVLVWAMAWADTDRLSPRRK